MLCVIRLVRLLTYNKWLKKMFVQLSTVAIGHFNDAFIIFFILSFCNCHF